MTEQDAAIQMGEALTVLILSGLNAPLTVVAGVTAVVTGALGFIFGRKDRKRIQKQEILVPPLDEA